MKMNDIKETEEIKTQLQMRRPSTLTCFKDSPGDASNTTPLPHPINPNDADNTVMHQLCQHKYLVEILLLTLNLSWFLSEQENGKRQHNYQFEWALFATISGHFHCFAWRRFPLRPLPPPHTYTHTHTYRTP